MAKLPPGFRLNLTGVRKNVNEANDDEEKKLPPMELIGGDMKRGGTVQPRSRVGGDNPGRQNATLARKNQIIMSSSSDSDDINLDELENVPVAKDKAPAADALDGDAVPAIKLNELPELNVDEGFSVQGDAGKFAILEDLLLPADLAEEPMEEWSYKSFIKKFANTEAAEDDNDLGDYGSDIGDTEEDYDD